MQEFKEGEEEKKRNLSFFVCVFSKKKKYSERSWENIVKSI